MKKGKEKRRTITSKKGRKGLKNASFWTINSQKLNREKKLISKEGGEEMIKMHNIYPCILVKKTSILED